MELYQSLKNNYAALTQQLVQRDNQIGLLRLLTVLLALGCVWWGIKNEQSVYYVVALLLAVIFIFLMQYHQKIRWSRRIHEALTTINDQEVQHLEGKEVPFENGQEFQPEHHAYAYDLDILGEKSLFRHLNRTGTYIGKKQLAQLLLSPLTAAKILDNQEAVQELSGKLNWRQHLLALATLRRDNQSLFEQLIQWSQSAAAPLSRFLVVFSIISPLVLVGLIVAARMTGDEFLVSLASMLFTIHLAVSMSQFKRMQRELVSADHIKETILQYSLIIKSIEEESFNSHKINALKAKLTDASGPVSGHIRQLSVLFSRLDSMHNLMGVTFLSGLFMYHIHAFRQLLHWKKQYAALIPEWLQVVGEIEALNSLGNFSANNPHFAFPQLNDQQEIAFEQLSHPLLRAEKRVSNDVHFTPQRFMLLTGSNMSGKSTFLRTLGINMVLAGVGAPVCATSARVHPLPVWVSMRLSDSLSDSESYFFAEIKRLREIMDVLETGPAFVLLDEILRGTNSDDKRSGTVEVVRKMVHLQAVGAIATHDLEVCNITDEYPETLMNKCFEVEIINNDLHFDYQLRDGICKNKSATFLMKKIKII